MTNNIIKFISDSNGLEDITNQIVIYIITSLKSILEPVSVSYSNEVLANQIYEVSVLLFILSVLIIFLIISLLFNILILINSDKIINFFTNKYIRWYVKFNMKIINIEVFFLGSSILYFMFNLSHGIHFLATHPIIL